jgi:outer membrane lipoprotein-sorting protein
MRRRRLLPPAWCLLSLASALSASCAPKPPALPTGAGEPFADFRSAYDEATAACRDVRTMTASMAMSGKAGETKLRGRIDAGFEAPQRARLEGRAPFGKPVFILVADAGRGTLVLPREDRVLRDAPPDDIVEALAGVRLDPDALRTAVAGCGLSVAAPSNGRSFSNGWVSIAVDEGTVYLHRNGGRWEVAAASRGPLTVSYADYSGGRPLSVRLRAESQGHATSDLTLRLSDVDINTTMNAKTFEVELPEHPVPLTLDELRRAGPLGGR